MRRLRLVLCVFLATICVSALATDLPLTISGRSVFGFGGRLFRDFHSNPEDKAASDYEKTYKQTLDNFDSSNKKTFDQRYFVNTQWNSTAVNVLYLEGESPASSSSVSDSNLPHVALAKDLKATVYCLEHRFYGASQPFQANTRNNLGFLSSRQAVEDIRNFVNAQNSATGQQNPKWIVVGASYAGALALWFRQKYPTLSAGVISSSPVVIPTNDFYTYERNVEVAYSNYSYECWHGIKFAALSIRNEIQYEEGVDRLNQHLKLVPQIDDYRVDYKSFQNLFSGIMKLFEIPVQYNKVNVGPFATKAGIDDVCKIMSDETVKDIDRVIQWAKYLYTAVFGHPDNFPGIPNSYENLVADLKNITLSDQWRASARSWFWQQCNEFGQFVTTDNSHGLFAATVPNDFFNGLCSEVFYGSQSAFTISNMTANVKQTANYFGASNIYKGSNAFIVNGDSDPWISLAPNVTTASSSAVYVVQGVGHNAVLQPSTNTDPVSLKMARNLLNRKAKSWISSNNRAQRVEQKSETVQEHRDHFVGHDHSWPKIKNWDAEIVYNAPHPNAERYAKAEMMAEKMPSQQPFSMKRVTTMTDVLSKKLGTNKAQNNIHGIKQRYLNTSYITQDVDHFDPNNNLKFAQQFLFNDIFQRDKDAPRFLMLGGEAAIDWPYVNGAAFAYYYWGDDFKAVLYALEHRYYGYSEPFSNTSVSNLRWMNTEQVLADTAVFVKAINKKESLDSPRWVIFGGSYPGNLAALFRYRYPDLSVGAVASSAPLQAKTDLTEYMQAVERDIKRYANEGCPAALRRFFAWVRKKMNTRTGRKEVKAAFCIENNWDQNYVDEKDAELLLANWVFRIDQYIQYDPENHWALNYLCHFFKNFDDMHGAEKTNRVRELFEATRNISATLGIPDPFLQTRLTAQKLKSGLINDQTSLIRPDGGDGNYDGYDDDTGEKSSDEDSGSPETDCYCNYCSWISYDQTIKVLQDIFSHRFEPLFQYWSGEDRLWFWLTCTQWGYAESTNYGYNHFESALPVNHVLDICYDVFGAEFTRARVDGGVRNTNYMYGGSENYNGTNVVFVNGSEDPWSWLGVYKPLNPDSVTSILIEGTSHCADMMREEKNDVKVLKDARKQIKDILIKWLKKK
ncbi:serine carboxypeptidase s28 domain-containing protein [Ditylenchus destructor]|nr:serine carboxypeptidase s28 domain-containing protein [Ditylenchus destructor]